MNTPEQIEELEDGQIFVFGSNKKGLHAGGAAAVAQQSFGAIWGMGEGLMGRSYAIPTMGTDEELAAAVEKFLTFAGTRPDLTFLVTKIGTGIAGRPIESIAPLFAGFPENVIIPLEFEQVLNRPEGGKSA